MSLQSHLTELERRHMALEREIEKEELHPSVDELKLHELKRRKLVLKDEIAKLRQTADKEMVH
ncbi:MAG: YdcH family protein [Rhodoblastus sp.]